VIFRKKTRYVMVEANDRVYMNDHEIQEALKESMKAFLGELPYFKANPQVAAVLSDKIFVLSVNRGFERNVALALSFVKNLSGRRVGFYTIRTSGTIRSIKDAFRSIY
jgi:RNase P/RNase MRP subunit POP5